MKYNFNVENVTNECIEWIRDWFDKNGKGCNAVIGMSGGKDSTITAALCARALCADRVIGVSMPDEGQSINDADKICEYLGIKYRTVEIGDTCNSIKKSLWCKPSKQTEQNIPPRVRMVVLYAIAQTENGRVACCDNASERFIGYSTLFGDNVGSFAPLLELTVTEVKAIGHYLGLPYEWVEKLPDDGLPNSSPDEEKIGFLYSELDSFIRGTSPINEEKKAKMMDMHMKSEFKRSIVHVPSFMPKFILDEMTYIL